MLPHLVHVVHFLHIFVLELVAHPYHVLNLLPKPLLDLRVLCQLVRRESKQRT